ncbi:MAG: YlxR family protein, partial [Alphaproteobacteria bacterium]
MTARTSTTDAGRPARPIRRCAATGARAERAAMVRFVRGPDDKVVPDLRARLPGRGVWVAARSEA